jgi:hypothetical protein
VLSTITVIHRISYTYTIANGRRLDPRGAATRAGVDPQHVDPQPAESQPVPIRPASGPGPISGTASVSAAEPDLIPAPNTRA